MMKNFLQAIVLFVGTPAWALLSLRLGPVLWHALGGDPTGLAALFVGVALFLGGLFLSAPLLFDH